MTKTELITTKENIFDNDFSIKTTDVELVKDFCNYLTSITGVQCCTAFGYTNELLPNVYNSVLDYLKE